MTANGSTRAFSRNDRAESPFHSGPRAALRSIQPHQDSVAQIKTDIAHTYAIAGYGKDELASHLIFLAVRCSLFSRAPFEEQLEDAFASFNEWCQRRHKTSTIKEFSKSELKITSLLGGQ